MYHRHLEDCSPGSQGHQRESFFCLDLPLRGWLKRYTP